MTLPGLFDSAVASHARDVALTSWSPAVSRNVSTAQMRQEVARFSAGLGALGLKKGDRVLLISENRPEWAFTDYATAFAGGILVPVYTSLTVEQLAYILDNSGATIAAASTQELLDKLMAAAAGQSALRQAIVFDQGAASENVMHLTSVCAMGDDVLARSPQAWREPAARLREEDVATIIYTSGTTGPPKGVMLSHGNLTSNIAALQQVLETGPEDTALSFLPLCHVTQRLADYYYFSRGVRIVYVKIEDLGASLPGVRPTTFPGVPRVFEKARDGILMGISKKPAPLRALARWSLATGRAMARKRLERAAPGAWLALRHAVADRLALSRVRQGMGGRLRYAVSGGAPLNPEVMEFFLSVGLPILQGYGLTETTVLTINRLDDFRSGTVGPPLPGVELKLEDDGEILARGSGIGRGYYLDVKRTEESFAGGWFRTGDLGRFDGGHLVITGRKKEILVTSGGKKVSPSAIEQSILQDPLVSQVVLVGDGHKYVSALLVPDRAKLSARLAGARGADAGADYEQALRRPEVREIFAAIIARTNQHLARYEQIKKFTLLPAELTQEGGELTPTLKIKRRFVEEKYREAIESMYADAPETVGTTGAPDRKGR